MNTWIALFRGINVGGHGRLPMKELVVELERLGCSRVRTYIQSGNAVFDCAESNGLKLSHEIRKAIQSSHGFEPRVMTLSYEEFRAAVAECPFPPAEADYKTVHLYFLAEPAAAADLDGMAALQAEGENYLLKESVFYLRTPTGFATSKLARKLERLLGVEATARNWRTVEKILEMANDS